jgi:hypothetical protein
LLEGGSLDLDAFAVPGVAPPDHLVDEAAVGSEILEVARAAQQELIAKHIVLGRTDFFDFVGRLVFVCLRVFDLAATRFELVFDLTRRFDEVLDLARFFAFFMIFPRSTAWFPRQALPHCRGFSQRGPAASCAGLERAQGGVSVSFVAYQGDRSLGCP